MEWAAHVIPPNPDQDAPENGRPGVQNGASKTVVLKDALPPILPVLLHATLTYYPKYTSYTCPVPPPLFPILPSILEPYTHVYTTRYTRVRFVYRV